MLGVQSRASSQLRQREDEAAKSSVRSKSSPVGAPPPCVRMSSVVLSARQAEEANRELAKASRSSNQGMLLVPVALVAPGSSTRPPRIHLSKAGEWLTRPPPGPGASSSGARSSSGQRRPREPDAAPLAPFSAVPGAASVTQQRSKRPKLTSQPRASHGGAAEAQRDEKALKACARVLKELLQHPQAWPFGKPVDPNQVPGYYDVITDPIDLGTIKKRLDNNQYDDVDELVSEVGRVWKNCYTFNKPDHDVRRRGPASNPSAAAPSAALAI